MYVNVNVAPVLLLTLSSLPCAGPSSIVYHSIQLITNTLGTHAGVCPPVHPLTNAPPYWYYSKPNRLGSHIELHFNTGTSFIRPIIHMPHGPSSHPPEARLLSLVDSGTGTNKQAAASLLSLAWHKPNASHSLDSVAVPLVFGDSPIVSPEEEGNCDRATTSVFDRDRVLNCRTRPKV